jgi:thioredoxin-related protein
MMKQLLQISILMMLTMNSYSQQKVSFEELPNKMATEPRPVVIKIYTDWCSICKLQDRQLLKNVKVNKMLSEKYYYLELNAETRKPLLFNDRVYKFTANGTSGINSLAAELCTSQSYPCWVFLSGDYKIISTYSGLLKPEQLVTILSNN